MKIETAPYESRLKDLGNTVLLIPNRLLDIKDASPKMKSEPEKAFAVNKVAKELHPGTQDLVITEIEELSADFKRFTFKVDGGKPVYFRAGQYLSFPIEVGNAVVTRAYSLSSSPVDAKNGFYQIAVKRVPDGFTSNFILDNWKVGDHVRAYAPEGTFVYEPLRDAKHLIGVAGGSGITPFLSLARALDAGIEDMNFTLLYGAKNKDELYFKDELDAIAKRCKKFNVVYVLSEAKRKAPGIETGFIGADLIKQYAPKRAQYSIFACGPKAMYNFLGEEVKKLGLRKKFVRFELQGAAANPAKKVETFKITVINRGAEQVIKAASNETVLVALERAGVKVPVRCRSGECGFCRSKVVEGQFYIPEGQDFRRIADGKFGYIHPCCAYPLSNMTIKIN